MEEQHTDTMKLWDPEELEIPEDVIGDAVIVQRRRFALAACLMIIFIVCIGLVGWHTVQVSQYQRIVHQNASFVAQQSARETACLHQAQTAAQRDTCAQTASAATASLQTRFDNVAIPASQQAAANEMQTAYAALAAASCYDSVNHNADDTCLGGISSRLRVAVLDANDAAQN